MKVRRRRPRCQNQSVSKRRRPQKVFYMKRRRPLWIYKLTNPKHRDLYLQMGDVVITKEEYESYPVKGKQDGKARKTKKAS